MAQGEVHGRSFLAHILGTVPPQMFFESSLVHFGTLLVDVGSLLVPFSDFGLPFGILLVVLGCLLAPLLRDSVGDGGEGVTIVGIDVSQPFSHS